VIRLLSVPSIAFVLTLFVNSPAQADFVAAQNRVQDQASASDKLLITPIPGSYDTSFLQRQRLRATLRLMVKPAVGSVLENHIGAARAAVDRSA